MASNPALSSHIIKEFVIAAHFDLAKVQAMLAENPALLTVEHQWGENDFEDGLGAASHMGNRSIAEYYCRRVLRLLSARRPCWAGSMM
jgi:hypothetical protein